ncbi:addiction module antidote protein, HigA family, partial [Salmonella enterica subsp. enterica serovar Braenderup]|uniref:HigA family addiction module antitoxin n=1 Tax=Salmonella enterica TaxID=28901 RepID=UPI000BA95178
SGLKINDLAEKLNVHRNSASALVYYNRKLSTDMAFRLAKAFDTTAKFWLNIQQSVDLWEVTSSPRMQEEIDRVIPAQEIIERKHNDDSSEKKQAIA